MTEELLPKQALELMRPELITPACSISSARTRRPAASSAPARRVAAR